MQAEKRLIKLSKFLSYVLRHRPGAIGLELDSHGWIPISDLLKACSAKAGRSITRADLDAVVATDSKMRFAVSEDGLRIRASQGHSIEVDLGYEPATPPAILYHGTTIRNLKSIRRHGLRKGRRHHVHLSADPITALAVGNRHGEPVVLEVRAGEMARAGAIFFRSTNGVWLTDHVSPAFIDEHVRTR